MSSFVGHGLTALFVALPNISVLFRQRSLLCWPWILWLVIVAWGPDIDYVWPVVHPSAHNGLRITHSLVASLLLPGVTGLWLWSIPPQRLPISLSRRVLLLQVAIASLSHVSLDLLVGVTPLPLLYPFSTDLFRLPLGILPSAGKINITNYYFWRNLYLEQGVLLPLLCSYWIYTWPFVHIKAIGKVVKWGAIALCLFMASSFLYECYGLPRP